MHKRKLDLEPIQTKKPKNDSFIVSEPWKAAFSDARKAFSENNFKESVALFTRALTLKPGHTTILDCRAASHEKLNQIDLALRDASSIISIAPTESRGYLRAGKLLMLQKKYKQAVNVYQRALVKVDPHDSRYAQIKQMKQTAEKRATPSSYLDFMQVLPYDVVSLIFAHLSFDRRVQCTGVSKAWRQFALNWSGMWRDLDFGHRKVPVTTIKKYLGYATGRHIRRFAMMDADKNRMRKCLQALIDADCQYLTHLDFVRCDIPLDVFLRMLRLTGKHVTTMRLDESSLSVAQILQLVIPAMPQLAQLSIIGLETGDIRQDSMDLNLTHLRLCIHDTDTTSWLIKQCKKLTLLDFYTNTVSFADFTHSLARTDIPELSEFHFTFGPVYQVKTQWASLKTSSLAKGLHTFGMYGDPSFTSSLLEFMVQKYHTTLKHLVIADCRMLDSRLAQLVVSPGLPQIQTLKINTYIALEEWDVHTIISSCPTLEDISMSWITGVTDSVMSDLQTVTKKLKRLDISNCNSVTGVGLQKVVKAHRSTLERLVLNNCQRISPDAVTWAVNTLGKRVVECKYKNM
ncbi:hypothetical protein CU098_008854 [Rhizopus stolonifer]|uniref:F-box domain-containing protein n=1 Tax=Rhizopus stolonifer TaxID=4846 RepID=A0A367KUY5_RHIST|nr:hypothetical protein CU098_008854 [Rhizopus stolonifer]